MLDTNVLLDFFETPRPEHATSLALVDALKANGATMCLAATSLKDVYYVLTRRSSEPAARRAVESLLATMEILPVDETCCHRAVTSTEPDFEDGIIRAAAELAQVDYLVSRDARAFVGSRVPRLSPAVAVKELAVS
jgi:predicted nucleic acid-binding protein